MSGAIERCASALGRGAARFSVGAVALGAVALVVAAMLGGARPLLVAVAAAWLYLVGIAAGAVAFSAAVRTSRGRWAAEALPLAESAGAFFPVALVLLAILAAAAPGWRPEPWASALIVGARDLVAGIVLGVFALRYIRRSRPAPPGAAAALHAGIAYLVVYAAALSLWAVDFILALEANWGTTVIPPLYFMGAFLEGIAWTALLSATRTGAPAAVPMRRDLAVLLFAFSIFWGYLGWAAFLPVWYGKLPDEIRPMLDRWQHGWSVLVLAVIALVLAFPFVFLLSARAKRGRTSLAIVAGSILLGLLGERFALVLPSVRFTSVAAPAIAAVGAALAGVGAFVLSAGSRLGLAMPDGVPR